MEIDLGRVPATGVDRDDLLLFSETQSRFIVTISPDKKKAFETAKKGLRAQKTHAAAYNGLRTAHDRLKGG